MFVITGVTGHVGRVTANLLLTQQQPVRAIVRNASKGAEWETKGAEVAVADLFDKASLFNAFKQAEGIFVMTPPALDLDDVIDKHLEMLRNIITLLTILGLAAFMVLLQAYLIAPLVPVLTHDFQSTDAMTFNRSLCCLPPIIISKRMSPKV